jgi:FkbM family methyltransferase
MTSDAAPMIWRHSMSDSQQGTITKEEYTRQFNELGRQSGGAEARLPLSPKEIQPMLEDRTPTFDFDGHYVYHVGWAAEILGKIRPKEHTDIGSYHYFSLIVSGFIPTQFLDYRPMELKGLENYSAGSVDLKNLNISSDSINSLSCMHVLEHIGLGRYGDDLDYDGDLKAASELKRVLAPGGLLLIAVPIGRPRIKFNAHRIYSTKLVFDMFDGLELLDFSLIPDNFKTTGIIRQSSFELADRQEYGCGCFYFRKPGDPRGNGMKTGESHQSPLQSGSATTSFKPLQSSYSQCGEDRIMSHLAEWLNIKKPTYLDIGAHDPVYLNNTYLFYQKGCQGVLVEPDPALFDKIAKARPQDTCLNIGISSHSEEMADFYVMDVPTLNTFSREEAERYCSYGERRIAKVIQIPLISVNDIIKKHFVAAPDILSLDVEGLDYEILTAIDFTRFRPNIICVETLTYTEDNTEKKLTNIIEFMKSVGYLSYADTFINTIFVSREAWKQRGNGESESSDFNATPPIKSDNKKLTVCIPTYRRPEFLKQCLASIDAQTLGKHVFRVMISDNASEIDKTEILSAFPDLDVKYYPQPVNLGAGGNYFFLMSQVQTEFTMIIPDDERLKPCHLERVLQSLLEDPRLVAAYSGYEYVEENSGIQRGGNVPILVRLDNIKGDVTWSYEQVLAMLALDSHVYTPCMVFRTLALRDIYRHFKFNAFYSGEKIIYSLLADYGLIRFINEPLLLARVGHHNISADIDDESKRADQRYTTEWVMKLGYSRGVDIQGFWRNRLNGPNQNINLYVANVLLGAFGEIDLQAIVSGTYWSDNKQVDFEPAFPSKLLAGILGMIPRDISIFSQVFHAHPDMPQEQTLPLERLNRETVPREFCIIDLAPENCLLQCQLENGLLPDHITKVVVAMPFLGEDPWGERMYFSRARRILAENGFTIQEHRILEAKENKCAEIEGLKPEKWGERAKNLVSTYLAAGIFFIASREIDAKDIIHIEDNNFDHDVAQVFELDFTRKFLTANFQSIYEQIQNNAKQYHIHGDESVEPGIHLNEFFNNDVGEFRSFVEDVKGKTGLEVGSGPCGVSCGWHFIGQWYVIDPLVHTYKQLSLEMFGKTWWHDNIILMPQNAELFIPELSGKIDGLIWCRNSLDHMADPFTTLKNLSKYAAEGCRLFVWTDLYHLDGHDHGHRNITRSKDEFGRFIENLGFRIDRLCPQLRKGECIEFGCVATKVHQNQSSLKTIIKAPEARIIIFSRDRAMQLEATIRSLLANCHYIADATINIIYTTTSEIHFRAYETLIHELGEYTNLNFICETDFREDFIAAITGSDYLLFLVDDNIFARPFSLETVVSSLEANPGAIGFSLRLGENTNYCYSLDSTQALPDFHSVTDDILSYHWPLAELDFKYPLEVSSSVYRTHDLIQLLQTLPFNNPNTLEDQLAKHAGNFAVTQSLLLCFRQSITFCNPVNKVQVAYNNRAGSGEFNSEILAQKFHEGYRVKVDAYAGFIPNACHQEVDLVFVPPCKVISVTESPLVSVIIPCYNQAHFLSDAVISVVKQTYLNWECIIVNDGSPDNTSDIARQLIAKHSGKNIRLLGKPNGGLSDARNAGIAEARGKYILPLDSDDLIHPQMLEKTVTVLESQTEFSFAYTDQIYFGAEEKQVRCLEYDFKTHLAKNYFAYCTLYLRTVWETVGGYKTSMKWGYEDWEFWISCGEKGFVGRRVPELLFYYRVKENSMVTQAREHDAELKAQIILNHPELYTPENIEWAKKIIADIQQ